MITGTMGDTSTARAAERELSAFLAVNRQRKEVREPPPASLAAPPARRLGFAPPAIAAPLQREWDQFLATTANCARRLALSFNVGFLVLISTTYKDMLSEYL